MTKPKRGSIPRSQVGSGRRKPLFFGLATGACIWMAIFWMNSSESTDPAKIQPYRPIADMTEWQIALAREGFSPGSIDGVFGEQTRQALLAYQTARSLPLSGSFDVTTGKALKIRDPVFETLKLSKSDFDQIGPKPQSWRARGQLDRMRFNSILEMVAERSESNPEFIRQLNPDLDWSRLKPGRRIRVPRVPRFRISGEADYIQIRLSSRTLRVYSAENRILFHCPVSIAKRVDKRPGGELRVRTTVADPNYTFSPDILSRIAQNEGITTRFVIQPGPNNPVGTVWIGLNLPGYGIHGTPEPEKVGRTESNGCFRLSNWNAQTLLEAARIGLLVYVEP